LFESPFMPKRRLGIFLIFLSAGWLPPSSQYPQDRAADRPFGLETQAVPGGGTFRALQALSSSVVWASGSRGSVCRTIDGGGRWEVLRVPGGEKLDFRSLAAFDADRALVANAGSPGFIFKTTDGGRNWKVVYKDDHPSFFIDAMAFWDDRRGLVLGDPIDGLFLFLSTEDGGESWSPMPRNALPAPLAGEAFFAASNGSMILKDRSLVWIASGGGETARVFISRDGGRSFKTISVPMAAGRSTRGIFGLALRSARECLAVGGDYGETEFRDSIAAVTEDGGKSWRPLLTSGLSGFRESAAFVPGRTDVLAVGPGGADYSGDNGRTWRPFALDGCHAIAFAPDGSLGWAAGNKGKIVRIRVVG
jgi:photosystem II stability/assembly factor-like uncharacterized protein